MKNEKDDGYDFREDMESEDYIHAKRLKSSRDVNQPILKNVNSAPFNSTFPNFKNNKPYEEVKHA